MDPLPATIPAPAGFLRSGVDAVDTVAVTLPSGAVVLIRHARVSATDYLTGKASTYALAALRARDAWIKASRLNQTPDRVDIVGVILEAIRDTYDAPSEIVEAWLEGVDASSIHAIAAAAIGATATAATRERGRAMALVAGGLGAVPMSPIDAASFADWSVNAGRAPAWGG